MAIFPSVRAVSCVFLVYLASHSHEARRYLIHFLIFNFQLYLLEIGQQINKLLAWETRQEAVQEKQQTA